MTTKPFPNPTFLKPCTRLQEPGTKYRLPIVNCFKKAKISATSQNEAINDCDDPFSDLKYQLDELTRRDPSLLQDDSTESFVGFDNDVQSSNDVMTEEEKLKEKIGDDDDDDDLDEDKE